MNSPAGKPRAQRPVAKRPAQLNLRRTPTWPEEDELNERPDGNFWKWFGIVFLFHVIAFIVLILLFSHRTKPPQEFISLLPPGDVVKGSPGQSSAHKIANTTPAPSKQAESTPPTPPTPPAPPKPKVHKAPPPTPKPTPIVKEKAPEAVTPPVAKPKPKPVKHKVKVDLTLANAPVDDTPAPPKPVKEKPKKPAHKSHAAPATTTTESQGLSKEEVAKKLGDEFHDSGVPQGTAIGANGDRHGHKNDFSDFYQAIHDQVMSKWPVPNAVDPTATDPVVQIHVEKDGRVPTGLVKLMHSSGNPAFDQSALDAARGMHYTLQPLPAGCPPDISIDFNLRQQ